MEIIINTILNLLYEHRYIFSFLGALLEGTYIMILAGVLYKFGYFNFWGLISILSIGYFLNGLFLYLLGRIGGYKILEKWGRKKHFAGKMLFRLEKYFEKHSIKTLFITRITYGLSMPALIIAGAFKMKWSKFLIVTIFATFIWIFAMLGVGYIFGISYEAIGSIAKKIATGLTIFLFVAITLILIYFIYWIRSIIKKRFEKKLDNNRNGLLKKISTIINSLIDNKNEKQ